MAVVIRLRRVGKSKKPCYRIVVDEAGKKTGGRVIERVGYYEPGAVDRFSLDREKVERWLKKGAQPSRRVRRWLLMS